MAINFPDSPSVNDTHTVGDRTWKWDGTVWNIVVGTTSDHGNLAGLSDDDHTQYLRTDGTRTAASLTVSGAVTVDTDTFVVDNVNDRVGIGTTSPDRGLHVDSPTAAVSAKFTSQHASLGLVELADSSSTTTSQIGTNGDDIVFRPIQTERMRIDSSGNVGIGTTSPAGTLDVNGKIHLAGGTNRYIEHRSGNNDILYHSDAGDFYRQDITNSSHEFFTGNIQRLKIDSSGNTSLTGYLSHPRAFFRAYKGGSTGWSLTGAQAIVFDNTTFNSGNNYSTTTGRFTAPVGGYYHFGAHFFKYTTYTNSTNTYWGIFTSNGYSTTTNHGTQGQDGGQSLSCIVYMGQNDYAEVLITTASTIQSYGTMSFNSFYGYLLSA